MAIIWAGLRCELREVELKDKPEAMLLVSGTQTVPILVLSDGRVIEESLDTMFWALDQLNNSENIDAESAFFEPDALSLLLDKAGSLELVQKNDGDFKHWLDRYKYHVGYPDHPPSYYRGKAEVFVSELEATLSNSIFLLGDKPRLADIAIFPFIRQFAFVDHDWFSNSEYVSVQRWLAYWIDSRSFKTCMTKFDKWRPDAEPCFFPL